MCIKKKRNRERKAFGRPKKRRIDKIENDMKIAGVSKEGVVDKVLWR